MLLGERWGFAGICILSLADIHASAPALYTYLYTVSSGWLDWTLFRVRSLAAMCHSSHLHSYSSSSSSSSLSSLALSSNCSSPSSPPRQTPESDPEETSSLAASVAAPEADVGSMSRSRPLDLVTNSGCAQRCSVLVPSSPCVSGSTSSSCSELHATVVRSLRHVVSAAVALHARFLLLSPFQSFQLQTFLRRLMSQDTTDLQRQTVLYPRVVGQA